MKIYSADELETRNYNVAFVNALRQLWHTTKTFQCIDAPKKQNLFLLLCDCKITYTDKYGKTLTANSGDVVYTPIGSEYRAQLFDFKNENSHTLGINFHLYDEDGENVALSDGIEVFHAQKNQALPLLFQKALLNEAQNLYTQNRILIMEIISSLGTEKSKQFIPDSITKALSYLSEHCEEAPSVATLAELSSISEVYFRKQFKAYMGMTPREYRNAMRLNKACTYLEYGDISVQEISDMLGYSTVSHFIKEFKAHYGTSPLKYRKQSAISHKF